MSFTRALNAPNCWRRAMLRRTHHPFRFFSFSFSSSSLICCSTANAPSKIAYSSSLLLIQLSAIAVKKHVCVCNGLHLMTSFTQLSRLDCLATTTCDMFSYEALVRVTPPKGLPNVVEVIGVSHLLYPPQLKQHPNPKFHKNVMAKTF